jgi:hypothetical protein
MTKKTPLEKAWTIVAFILIIGMIAFSILPYLGGLNLAN